MVRMTRTGLQVQCRRCKFHNAKTGEYGDCRRHAPKPTSVPNWEWPLVAADDWCGEFRPDAEFSA